MLPTSGGGTAAGAGCCAPAAEAATASTAARVRRDRAYENIAVSWGKRGGGNMRRRDHYRNESAGWPWLSARVDGSIPVHGRQDAKKALEALLTHSRAGPRSALVVAG